MMIIRRDIKVSATDVGARIVAMARQTLHQRTKLACGEFQSMSAMQLY
jgi:hypothetical protein